MENLNPILTLLIGAISGVILLLLFPELRLARFRREIADSEKVSAETDSIQLGAIADYLIAATKSTIDFSNTIQTNASSFADALKRVADGNIELLSWVREKEKEIAEERHLLVARIDELSLKIRQIEDEKNRLEDDLSAAKIKIEKLQLESEMQGSELKQLEKDHKALQAIYNALKNERDNLLIQVATIKMPDSPVASLVSDTLETHILSQEEKHDENPKSDGRTHLDAGSS